MAYFKNQEENDSPESLFRFNESKSNDREQVPPQKEQKKDTKRTKRQDGQMFI
jgi:hypothetical protein